MRMYVTHTHTLETFQSIHKVNLLEDDPCLRATCKTRALDDSGIWKRALETSKPSVTQSDSSGLGTGIGLLGLGDQDYAVGQELFKQFANGKSFADKMAGEWRDAHSDVKACSALDLPSVNIPRQCSSFCVTTALEEHGVDRELFNQVRGLLLHVNRAMQDLYKAMRKQITGSIRHPLLFIRAITEERSTTLGWLLTRAVFKPKAIDGIALKVPLPDLKPLCEVELADVAVENSEYCLPNFVCIDEISFTAALMKQRLPGSALEYCYNPPYDLDCAKPLTKLVLTKPINWIGGDTFSSHDSDDDGDDTNAKTEEEELCEIDSVLDELLSSLGDTSKHKATSKPASKPKPKRKAAQTNSKKETEGEHGVLWCVLIVCCLTFQLVL